MNTWRFSPTWVASFLIATSSFSVAQERAALSEKPTVAAPAHSGGRSLVFQPVRGWGALPKDLSLGPTHGGIVVDKKGNVYASTNGPLGIFVFARDGRFLRTMAPEFAGTHSLTIAEENGTEYLYGVHLRHTRAFKMTLDGKPVLLLPFPKEAGIYGPKGEGYKPTAIAVAPDGSIFVADGYGTNFIHKFDRSGKYLGSFGGKGQEDGKFLNCHGLAIDTRYQEPLLMVCDYDNRRLQHFTLDGNFVAVLAVDFGRPASVSIFQQYVAVAELEGRVTILNQYHKPVAYVGDNPDKTEWGNFKMAPTQWREGVFVAPHGITWDKTGSLYVQEWSMTGRITKLEPVR